MPIYEFLCECKLKFEKYFSKISNKQEEVCPDCGKPAKRVISSTNFAMKDSKKIPKEIDLKVGKDAEKRWLAYEDKKSQKEKVREEAGSYRLSRDPEGTYTPLTVTKDGEKLSEKEAVDARKEMFKTFNNIKNNPKVKKEEVSDK